MCPKKTLRVLSQMMLEVTKLFPVCQSIYSGIFRLHIVGPTENIEVEECL